MTRTIKGWKYRTERPRERGILEKEASKLKPGAWRGVTRLKESKVGCDGVGVDSFE